MRPATCVSIVAGDTIPLHVAAIDVMIAIPLHVAAVGVMTAMPLLVAAVDVMIAMARQLETAAVGLGTFPSK